MVGRTQFTTIAQYKICNNQHDFDTNKRSRPIVMFTISDIEVMSWYWILYDIILSYVMSCHDIGYVMSCHDIESRCHDMISGSDVMPCYRVYWRVQFHDINKLNSISCDIICRCSSCHAMISSRCHGMISYVMSCHVMISSIHEPRVVLSISNNNVIAYNA